MIETYRGSIYPWQCDQMGHMNVMWYVGKFDEATWNLFAMLGLTRQFMKKNDKGMAALRQEIDYKKELLAGDIISIRTGILEVKQKTLRFLHEMKNDVTGDIASTSILTGCHIDTCLRKSCVFPEEIREKAESHVMKATLKEKKE
jgi:acyl-CoA thioester hydrolase